MAPILWVWSVGERIMKVLGVFFFIAALSWTWQLSQKNLPINLETHTAVQSEVVELIRTYILRKKPNVEDIRFDHIWTEGLDSTKLKVFFAYSFEEEFAPQQLQPQKDGPQMFSDGISDVSSDNEAQSLDRDEKTTHHFTGSAILNRLGESNEWSLDNLEVANNSLSFQKGTTIEVKPKK